MSSSPKSPYQLHRLTNTLALFGLNFALLSGKMMDEKWLPILWRIKVKNTDRRGIVIHDHKNTNRSNSLHIISLEEVGLNVTITN